MSPEPTRGFSSLPLTPPPGLIERLRSRPEPDTSPAALGFTEADRLGMLERQAASRRRLYKVPADYADASLADLTGHPTYPDHPQRDVLAAWWESDSKTLLLVGAIGTGKTRTAYAIGNQALTGGAYVIATTVAEYLEDARPGVDQHTLGDKARMCDLLILDDLGAERETDWSIAEATLLVDIRVRENRRTIVTTNASAEELEQRHGRRIVDRLAHRATVVSFTGPSRRRRAW